MDSRLHKWIVERLEQVPPAEFFSLYHASAEGMSELLARVRVAQPGEDREAELEAEAERLNRDLGHAARAHVEAFEGTRQRYKVTAEAGNDLLGTFAFLLGARQPSSDVQLSEPVNEKGLLGQLMRHNETQARTMQEIITATIMPVIEENRQLRRQRDSDEDRRVETFRVWEELHSQSHERSIELKDIEQSREWKNKALEALFSTWIPEVIKRIDVRRGVGSLPAPSPVSQCQARFRDVVRVIEKKTLVDSLSLDSQTKLDSLLGLGKDPENIEEFRTWLIEVWQELPKEVSDAIGNHLADHHPDKAQAFVEILGVVAQ